MNTLQHHIYFLKKQNRKILVLKEVSDILFPFFDLRQFEGTPGFWGQQPIAKFWQLFSSWVPGESRAAGIHVCNESAILPSAYNGSTHASGGRSSAGVSQVSAHVLSRKYWPLLVQAIFFKIYIGQTALKDRDCVCEKRMLYPSEEIWVFQALGSWPRIFHRHALWPRLQPHVGKGNWELMQEMLVLWLLLFSD